MRILGTIILLLVNGTSLLAQIDNCNTCTRYNQFIQQGGDYLEVGLFEKALIEFQSAQVAARVCGCSSNVPANGINKAILGIVAQRDAAQKATKEAEEIRRALEIKSKGLFASLLTNQSINLLNDGQYNEALLKAIEAHLLSPSDETEQMIGRAYQSTIASGGYLLTQQFQTHTAEIYSLTAAPDKSYFISAAYNEPVVIWNPEGQQKGTIPLNSSVKHIAFSKNSTHFVIITQDQRAFLFNARADRIAELDLFVFNEQSTLTFSPKGNYILYHQAGLTGRIWNLKGELINDAFSKQATVRAIADVPFFELNTRKLKFIEQADLLIGEGEDQVFLVDVFGRAWTRFSENGDTVYISKTMPNSKPMERKEPSQQSNKDANSVLGKFQKLIKGTGNEEPENQTLVDLRNTLDFPPLHSLSIQDIFRLFENLYVADHEVFYAADKSEDLATQRKVWIYPDEGFKTVYYYEEPLPKKKQFDLSLKEIKDKRSVTGTKKALQIKGASQAVYELIQHETTISAFSLSNDSKQLLSASEDGFIKTWNLEWPQENKVKIDTIGGWIAKISPNGAYFVVHQEPFYLNMWDWKGNRLNENTIYHLDPNTIQSGASFVKGGNALMATFKQFSTLYNKDGSLLRSALGPLEKDSPMITENQPSTILNPAGRYGVSINQKNRKALTFYTDHKIEQAKTIDHQQRVILLDSTGRVNLWTYSGKMIKPLTEEGELVFSIDANEQASTFLLTSDKGAVSVWNQDGRLLSSFQEYCSAFFSKQGNYIITQNNSWLKVWTKSGKEIYAFQNQAYVDFSADERFFLIKDKQEQIIEIILTPKGLLDYLNFSGSKDK